MTSCTLLSASMAKPVWRQAMTSEWSPKMESACVATVRALTWNTARQLLGGDLVHVGDHEQQALGGGVGGGEGTGGERSVDRAGSSALGLHLAYLHRGAEDVLLPGSRPLVHEVGHRARRGDGVDACHLGERIGHVGCGVVAVHGLEFSGHTFLSSMMGLSTRAEPRRLQESAVQRSRDGHARRLGNRFARKAPCGSDNRIHDIRARFPIGCTVTQRVT